MIKDTKYNAPYPTFILVFYLFYFRRQLFNDSTQFFLPRDNIKLPPKVSIIFKMCIRKYSACRHPFFTLETGHIICIHLTGNHFKPCMQGRRTKPLPFKFHFKIKIATNMIHVINAIPLPVRNGINHLLRGYFPLPCLSFYKHIRSLPHIGRIDFKTRLNQRIVFSINI